MRASSFRPVVWICLSRSPRPKRPSADETIPVDAGSGSTVATSGRCGGACAVAMTRCRSEDARAVALRASVRSERARTDNPSRRARAPRADDFARWFGPRRDPSLGRASRDSARVSSQYMGKALPRAQPATRSWPPSKRSARALPRVSGRAKRRKDDLVCRASIAICPGWSCGHKKRRRVRATLAASSTMSPSSLRRWSTGGAALSRRRSGSTSRSASSRSTKKDAAAKRAPRASMLTRAWCRSCTWAAKG